MAKLIKPSQQIFDNNSISSYRADDMKKKKTQNNNSCSIDKDEQILYGLYQNKYQGFRKTANSFTKPHMTDQFQFIQARKNSISKFSEALRAQKGGKKLPIKTIRKVSTASSQQRRVNEQDQDGALKQFELNQQRKNGLVVVKSREDLKQGGVKTMIRIRPQTPRINLLERNKRNTCIQRKEQFRSDHSFQKQQNNLEQQQSKNKNIDNMIKSGLLFDDFDQQIQALLDGQQQIDQEFIKINQNFLSDYLGIDAKQFEKMKKIQFKINAAKHNLQAVGEILFNLTELKLSSSIIHNIRDIGTSFRQLKVLWISRCSINDLGGLVAFQCLQELYASFNNIQDVYDLTHLTNLKIVDIEGNNVSELDQIDYLSSSAETLIELSMQNNPVSSQENWIKYVRKVRQIIGFMNYDTAKGRGLKFLDDEFVQTVIDRLKIEEMQGNQIQKGDQSFNNKQSNSCNAVENLLSNLQQDETKEALQTSILLANASDSQGQEQDKQQQGEDSPSETLRHNRPMSRTDGFSKMHLNQTKSQKRLSQITKISNQFTRQLSFLKKMQTQGIIDQTDVTEQFKQALKKLKNQPKQEQILLKSIKNK